VALVKRWLGLVVFIAVFMAACGGEVDGDNGAPDEGDSGGGTSASAADTGRMSEGEFDAFKRYDAKLVSESLQWSEGYQTCARIGETGDLAGFRQCITEAWDGFEDAALLARTNADDTLGDVAKQCRKALRGYMKAVTNVYATNATAHKIADTLQIELLSEAFKQLPPSASRYAKASRRAHSACEPR